MKTVLSCLLFLCTALVVLGCGKSEVLVALPAGTDGLIYAVGIGESRNPSIAQTMATQKARAELALAAEANVTALAKDFEEQLGAGVNAQIHAAFSVVSQSLTDGTLREVRTIKTQVTEKDGLSSVQVMLGMPIKANLEEPLVKEISRGEALYQEFQAWKGHNELSKKVELLRERETQQ